MTLNTTVRCRRDLRNARRTVSFLPTLQGQGDTVSRRSRPLYRQPSSSAFVERESRPCALGIDPLDHSLVISAWTLDMASPPPFVSFLFRTFLSAPRGLGFAFQPSAFISDTIQSQKTHSPTQKTRSRHTPDTIEKHIRTLGKHTLRHEKHKKIFFSGFGTSHLAFRLPFRLSTIFYAVPRSFFMGAGVGIGPGLAIFLRNLLISPFSP